MNICVYYMYLCLLTPLLTGAVLPYRTEADERARLAAHRERRDRMAEKAEHGPAKAEARLQHERYLVSRPAAVTFYALFVLILYAYRCQ